MALPAVFDPVEYGDRLLVDGGVLMNVPVSVGKDSGADIIIAVDVGSPLAPKENVQNILQILYQLTGVVTVVNSRQQVALLGDDDFLLFPPIGDEITTGSFARATEAIPAGYSEAMKHRGDLSRLTISEDAWQQRQAAIKLCVDGPPIIDFVRVNNQSRFSDEAINRRLTIATGQELDLESLQQQLQDVYSLGFLQSVTYKIVEEGELTGVQIDVLPDSRGTVFFEYGLGVSSSNFESNFNIRLGILKTDVGRNGGEFRGLVQIGQDLGGMTELYMPLSSSLKYVFVPRIAAERTDLNVFDGNGNRLAQLDIEESIAQLGIGREFGNDALVLVGVRTGSGNVDIGIGDPGFPAFDFNRGEYFVDAHYDTQDHRYFPGTGILARARFSSSTQSLGADQEFEQLSSFYMHTWTAGRHSFLAGTEIDVSSDDAIPVQSLYRAGGFPRMSGFEYNELLGENFGMLIAGYRYKMLEGSFFPGYLGGTIEYGNVHSDSADLFSDGIMNGSVYLGIDSLLGPLYLGMGFAEGGRRVPFLSIGSIFARDSLVR
jgi:NTE family protein